jgi:hypothetical protein
MSIPANRIAPPPIAPEGIKPAQFSPEDYRKEYATASGYNMNVARILSQTIETIEKTITPQELERMERDPVFAKIKGIIITGVLSDDPAFAPGSTEEEAGSKEEYDKYVRVLQHCEDITFGLETPVRLVWKMMLKGMGQGHKIAEINWDFRPGPDGKPQLIPVSVKPKPRDAVRFVVDSFWTILGFWPSYNRVGGSARGGVTATGVINLSQVLPRDKGYVFTWDMTDCDPRGNSAWLPGHMMYSIRQLIPQEFFRYLVQCAVPGLKFKLPPSDKLIPFDFVYGPDGQPVPDPDHPGEYLMENPIASANRLVEGFRNASGAIYPDGGELDAIKTGDANGDVFPNSLRATAREIEESVLLQSLAQSEGDKQSKAASTTVEGRLYALFFWIKWLLASGWLKQVCEPSVRKNIGDWAVAYMPTLSLGDSEPRDWVAYLAGLADAYFKGLLDDTQRPEIMSWMMLPKPGPSQKSIEADRQAQQAKQDPRTGTAEPSKRPDKPTPGPGTGDAPKPRKENGREDFRFSSLYALGNPGRRFIQHVRHLPRRYFPKGAGRGPAE